MKKLSFLIFGIIFISCQFKSNKDNSISKTQNVEISSLNTEIANNQKESIESKNKIIEEKQKIEKSFVLIDSIKIDKSLLIDTMVKYNPNLPIIYPKELSENLQTTFKLNDSILIISFFIDSDYEVMRFTKWKINEDSTIKYLTEIKPDFYTKYSFATIRQQIRINDKSILIGETSGGEGGENWQNIWVSQINEFDSIEQIGNYETAFESEDYIQFLDYEIIQNEIIIYEKIDSLIEPKKRSSIDSKQVKTIKIE